jgi:hypothetical protein
VVLQGEGDMNATRAFFAKVGIRLAWPAIALLGLIFVATPASAEDPPALSAPTLKPSFELLDGAAATLSSERSGLFKLDLPVRNSGTKQGAASLKLVSDMDKKCDQADITSEPASPITLERGAVAILHVTISKITPPATCYLQLVTEKETGNTLSKQVKLAQHHVTSTIYCAFQACSFLAVIVAFGPWYKAHKKLENVPACYKLGTPAWDFAKSWTSTTTLLGAMISTALTLTALPDLTKYASKSGYAALALLISLLVVIAPYVFVAFRSGTVGKDLETKKNVVIYEGCVWLFVVSCAITLFTGLAQIVLLMLLLGEVFHDGEAWLVAPAAAVAFSMCWYVAVAMYLTIDLQKKVDAELVETAAKPDVQAFERTKPGTTAVRVKPVSWPVL